MCKKIYLLLVFLMFPCGVAFADNWTDNWTYVDTIYYDNGDVYYGDVLGGVANGNGTRSYNGGGLFVVGNFTNGVPNGKVTVYFTGLGKYEGDCINFELTGQGTWTGLDGEKYKGGYVDFKKNGYGEWTLTNGDMISCNFKNDKLDGIVKWHWKDKVFNCVYKDGVDITPSSTVRPLPALPATEISPSPTQGVIESKIDGDFEGWDGETIFKLLNGQIWQQSSYSYKYHYAFSPNVLIYRSGSLYKMHVDGVDKDIYVTRLK